MQIRIDDSEDALLGFGLEVIGGRGLLSARDQRVGPLELKLLELEVPELEFPQLEFPFDVSERPEAFKSRRCVLRHLALGLELTGIGELLALSRLKDHGFSNLRVVFNEGFMELAGTFTFKGKEADFTVRVSVSLEGGQTLNLVFYDVRLYGWLGVPAALIPVYLRTALGLSFVTGTRCGFWELAPAGEFLRNVLPRMGWKVPDYREATITSAGVAADQLILVCGEPPLSGHEEPVHTEPSPKSVYAAEAMGLFREAEEAIAEGNTPLGFEAYRRFVRGPQSAGFARERLLQLGVCERSLHGDTTELAFETLSEEPTHPQALLALAAIALCEDRLLVAAEYYQRLGAAPSSSDTRLDKIAAELAAAQCIEHGRPGEAIAHYEAVASRDRKSVKAYEGMLRLRLVTEDWLGAKRAGERLVRLDLPAPDLARHWCDLACMYRNHFDNLKQARRGFERSLQFVPEYEPALEGLAETYIEQNEPARAVSYLTRLFEKARSEKRVRRVVELGLRLGRLWEEELDDLSAAAEHYQFVVTVDQRNREVRFKLAAIHLNKRNWEQARCLLDELIALTLEDESEEALEDFVNANLGLAALVRLTDGENGEFLECLERVLDRVPNHREALEAALPVFRAEERWEKVAGGLRQLAAVSESVENEIDCLRECGVLMRDRLRSPAEAFECFIEVLELAPLDLVMIGELRELADNPERLRRYGECLATALTTEDFGSRHGALWFDLAGIQSRLEAPPELLVESYFNVLKRDPSHYEAARALVPLFERVANSADHIRALDLLAGATPCSEERGDALLKRAKLLWLRNSTTRDVEKSLREAIKLLPGKMDGWFTLAEFLESEDRPAEAVSTLEGALEAGADSPSDLLLIHERLARLARLAEDWPTEVSHLEFLVSRGGAEDVLCERLLVGLKKLERVKDVAHYLEAWADHGDILDSGRLYHDAVLAWQHAGKSGKAIELCERLIKAGQKAGEGEDGAEARGWALSAALDLENIYRTLERPAGVVFAVQAQLELAPADAAVVLEKLLEAQRAAEDPGAAEGSAQSLLELSPQSRMANRFLAQKLESEQSYVNALGHWMSCLSSFEQVYESPETLYSAFERAVGLAKEVSPESCRMLERLYKGEESIHHYPSPASAPPLGELLHKAAKWEELINLRRWQSENKIPGDHLARKYEIAEVLYRRLGRREDAKGLLRELMLFGEFGNEFIQKAQNELHALLEESGAWEELAESLLELSVARQGEEAFLLLSRAVRIYGSELNDPLEARRAARVLLQRFGGGEFSARLASFLRENQLHSELASLLEGELEREWSLSDGHFVELIELYLEVLEDPGAASALCRKAIERSPESAVGWETLVTLLDRFSGYGSVETVLESWANHAAAGDAERIYRDLYRRLSEEGEGRFRDAVEVLGKLVEASSNPLPLLDELVTGYEHLGEGGAARRWLEFWIERTHGESQRDDLLRRGVELVEKFSGELDAALGFLGRLAAPTSEEVRLLAKHLVESGDFLELERYRESAGMFSTETLRDAGRHWLKGRDLARAEYYLSEYFLRERDGESLWAELERAFGEAGRLDEFGRWKVRLADLRSPGEPDVLRLMGCFHLVTARLGAGELGRIEYRALKDEVERTFELDREFEALDFTSASEAGACFSCASFMENTPWRSRSARALELLLGEEDPRLESVLEFRYSEEMERPDFYEAVKIARRRVTLGAEDGFLNLLSALEAGGFEDELMETLEDRSAREGGEALGLWARLATLHRKRENWEQVSEALGRVSEQDFDFEWGVNAYESGVALGQLESRVKGASVCRRFAGSDQERAEWSRREGRLLWWELDRVQEGQRLLVAAHLLSPLGVLDYLQLANESEDREAFGRWLSEGILLYDAESGLALRLELIDFLIAENQKESAKREFATLSNLVGGEQTDWKRIAGQARALEEPTLELRAWESACYEDRDNFGHLCEFVESQGEWEKLTGLLSERAEELAGEGRAPEAAELWEQAARIARERLSDSHGALNYWVDAARASPGVKRLWTALELAMALELPAVVVELTELLLKVMDQGDPERDHALRVLIVARENSGGGEEISAALQELVTLGRATMEEHLRLAERVSPLRPALAAELYEGLAEKERDYIGVAEFYYLAAFAWERAARVPEAVSALTRAFGHHFDDLRGYQLGLGIIKGAARIPVIEGFIAKRGDEGWDKDKRAGLRGELSTLYLEDGQWDNALTWIEASSELVASSEWVALREQALEGKRDYGALTGLWMEEGNSLLSPWSGKELRERLLRASEYYREESLKDMEFQALRDLAPLLQGGDERLERLIDLAADFGDRSLFESLTERHLEMLSGKERAPSVIRYAGYYFNAFEDEPRGLNELETQFEIYASEELAFELERCYRRGDRLADAYRVYRRLLKENKASERARSFCLDYTEEQGQWLRWQEHALDEVRLCQDMAGREVWLARVAECQVKHQRDYQAACGTLSSIPVWGHHSSLVGQDLFGALVESRLFSRSLELLSLDRFEEDKGRELGEELVAQASLHAPPDLYERAVDWLNTHSPESEVAIDAMVSRARRQGDLRGVLDGLLKKLRLFTVPGTEKALRLSFEAGTAASELGENAVAAALFKSAWDGGNHALEVLLGCYRCAERAENDALKGEVLNLGYERRDKLLEWISGQDAKTSLGCLQFLEEVYRTRRCPEDVLEMRFAQAEYLPALEKKKLLRACLDELKTRDSQRKEVLYQRTYNLLIGLAEGEGAKREGLRYRVSRAMEADSGLEELFELYQRSLFLKSDDFKEVVLKRAALKASSLPSFLSSLEGDHRRLGQRFVVEVYDQAEDWESAVEARLKQWETDPPTNMPMALKQCLGKLESASSPKSSSLLNLLHQRLLHFAKQSEDVAASLLHGIALLEGGYRSPEFSFSAYQDATRLDDLRGRTRVLEMGGYDANEFFKWARSRPNDEVRVEALEFVSGVLRAQGDWVRSVLLRLDVIDTLESAPARAALEECRELLDGVGVEECTGLRFQILIRQARLAALEKEPEAAVDAWKEALGLDPDHWDTVSTLRRALEQLKRLPEAAELRERELTTCTVPDQVLEHLHALVECYREVPEHAARRLECLEQANGIKLLEPEQLEQLLAHHEERADWQKYYTIANDLIKVSTEELSAGFFEQLGKVCEEHLGKLDEAILYYGRTLDQTPENSALKQRLRKLCQDRGELSTFAELESDLLEEEESVELKLKRLFELMGVYRDQLDRPESAEALKVKALGMMEDNRVIIREIADEFSASPGGYRVARDIYSLILEVNPLDVTVIRILARLCGQLKEIDSAYGYYAALLAMVPGDEEARRYVEACRETRPDFPSRSLSEEECHELMPAAPGREIEEFFKAVASSALAATTGSLTRRGIAERDRLKPTESKTQQVVQALEVLGVLDVSLFLWRGGRFECEVEMGEEPAFLLGGALLNSESSRERLFLITRVGELFRRGHLLCCRGSLESTGKFIDGLIHAIDDGIESPRLDVGAKRFAGVVGELLSEGLKERLKPGVMQFRDGVSDAELSAWREGVIAKSGRVALLLTCDLSEAVSAICRQAGLETGSYQERMQAIKETPELFDLVQFGLSEPFFRLRRELGLSVNMPG